MRTERSQEQRRDLAHKVLFFSSLALLVIFAAWCILLLIRAQRLNRDLDLRFGWMEEMRTVRVDLERLRDRDSNAAPERFQAFIERTEALVQDGADPKLLVDARNLRESLTQLTAAVARSGDSEGSQGENPPSVSSEDALWKAAVAAQSAAEILESHMLGHISTTREQLSSHWRSLYLLVFLSLALAGSNFFFLVIAHRRRRQIEEANVELLDQASHDPLTGLWNREGILRLLSHELVRSQRAESEIGVILADLDRFQEVNKLLGEDQGDYVLQQVAKRLEALVRPYDIMGRFGGDSFMVVLPACDEAAVEQVAERLVQAINDQELEHAFGHIRLTLTLAELHIQNPHDITVDQLLLRLREKLDRRRYKTVG